MNNLVISWIRTTVPVIVGSVIAYLVSKGISVPEDIAASVTGLLTVLFTALYYIVVRQLEQWKSKFGLLLGVASQPKYKK